MTIELPWPPSVNHYWMNVRGRTILGKKGKDFRKRVAEIVALDKQKTLTDRLAVKILAYPPDKRRRDIDNIMKALLDSLEHSMVYDDDSQIDDLRIIRKEVQKPGRVVVEIISL